MSLNYKKGNPVGNLLQYLNNKMTLSSVFNPTILPMLIPKKNKIKWLWSKPKDTFRTAIWLDEGYGCSYKMLPDKHNVLVKHIIEFFPPKTIMLDAAGFFDNKPTDFFYEIAAKGVTIPFNYTCFEKLKLTAPEAEALANKILAELLKVGTAKNELNTFHGIDRYHQFISIYGQGVLQAYSQRDVAVFMGFTPEHLNNLLSNNK